MKLVHLTLSGGAKWPEELSFDVFSRCMPKTLGSFHLDVTDWTGKDLESKIAAHIPLGLSNFHSSLSKLRELVAKARNPPAHQV